MADLCTLTDVKGWLKLEGTTASDAQLTRLITATSSDFLAEIKRPDLTPAADYRERRVGDGTDRILTRHWPINSVTSVIVDGAEIAESEDLVADGWYFEESFDPEERASIILIGSTFTKDSAVVLSYNAGYAEVPPDVSQAVIEWVSYRYKGREFIGQTSKHLNQGEVVSFQQVDVPERVGKVIERYRRKLPLL